MNYIQFKEIYDFSMNPNKSNLTKFHEVLINYPLDQLKINSPLFLNCLFMEIRKLSSISELCLSELLVLLERLQEIDNLKILFIVLEEISNFIQNLIIKKSKENDFENFECVDIYTALNIIKIFNIIFSRCFGNEFEQTIYSSSGLLLQSYIVSFLLYFVKYYKERDIQTEALSVLLYITDFQSSFIIEKANFVVHFAPGIFGSLTQVIQSDRKVGSIIKSKALKCFGNLLVLLCGDKSFSDNRNKLKTRNDDVDNLVNMIVERSDEWKKKTWDNMELMIKICKYSVIGRAEEEHWKVRRELVRISVLILVECSCVGSAVVDLVDCLIVLSSDTDKTVSDEASRALEKVTKINFTVPIYWDRDENNCSRVAQSGTLILSSVVRNNIDSVIETLGKLTTTLTDDGKCNTLQMLDGYLKIYESHNLGNLNLMHLEQILSNLVKLCALEYSTIDLLEISHVTDSQINNSTLSSCDLITKSFVHFYSDRVYDMIKSVISRIVVIVNTSTLLCVLNSLSVDNQDIIGPILLITRLVISSLSNKDSISDIDKVSACKTVLTTYFHPDYISLPSSDVSPIETPPSFWENSVALKGKTSQTKTVTLYSLQSIPSTLKKNALTLALVMELCAACSVCLSKVDSADDVESWLMRTCLFEVMSKGQQSPRILSFSASQTLHILSLMHPKYDRSISALIRVNSDYIMDAVARRLRSGVRALRTSVSDLSVLARLEGTCRCLVTLCQHADIGVLPFLSVILDQMLFCLDSTHGVAQCTFMDVLREVVRAVVRWTDASLTPILAISDTSETNEVTDTEQSNTDIVRAFLRNRHDILVSSGLRKETETEVDDIADTVDTDGGEPSQDSPKPSATAVIVRKIIDRCIHMSSSSCVQVRVTCLQILNDAICALQTDQDLLAQTVNDLWSPLEHRLSDKQFPVIIRAFDLLNTISQLCGGFLLIKIRTNLISKLCSILETGAKIGVSAAASLRYTGLYKLQSAMLHFVARLCVRTGLVGALLEEVVDALLPYLDDRYPPDLTEACLGSLRQLMGHNPGLVWYKVAQIDPSTVSSHIYGHRSQAYNEHLVTNARQIFAI